MSSKYLQISKRGFIYKLWDMGAYAYHVLSKDDDDKINKLLKMLLFSRNVTAIYNNNNDILFGKD